MYNLDSVLYECKITNLKTSHYLYDSTLKQDMEQLEKEYLGASKQNASIALHLRDLCPNIYKKSIRLPKKYNNYDTLLLRLFLL